MPGSSIPLNFFDVINRAIKIGVTFRVFGRDGLVEVRSSFYEYCYENLIYFGGIYVIRLLSFQSM